MTSLHRLRVRWFVIASVVFLAVTLMGALTGTVSNASGGQHHAKSTTHNSTTATLPAPPRPPTNQPTSPWVSRRHNVPTPLKTIPVVNSAGTTQTNAVASASNAAPGAASSQKTLVLYDTTGQWGWLGEAYAVNAANLVSHGSAYTLAPVSSYVVGEMTGYTGVVYVGSTYNEPIPTSFLDDVLAGSRPVIWMGDNIWQLSARSVNFTTQYGFSPGYFDFTATPTVTYKGMALNRDPLASASGLLPTTITDPTKATVLAVANRADGSSLNWATKGANLTYIGELPFSYVGATDRYFAAADLVTLLANPTTTNPKRALVRLEDVSPKNDPAELKNVINYLYNAKVPFSINVIPLYLDPKGYYNNGVPESITLAQAPALVTVLKYALTHGGTLIMEGYTHQYSNINNPYTGVSGDDFEFYLSHVDATNTVIYDGPVPVDSATWAQGRITAGKKLFTAVQLPVPTTFLPPHYGASAIDYTVFASNFTARYDRGLYFGGWCAGGACGTGKPDYTKLYGQYFPFLVRDIYGSPVIPEALGDIELVPYNNHPVRLPADVLASAKGLSVVTGGVQSFFYDPTLGTSYLTQVVTGIKALGYTFVAASTVSAG